MPPHDGKIGNAEGTRGLDVLQVAAFQEFGPNVGSDSHPGGEVEDGEQQQGGRNQKRTQDDQDVQTRDRTPDFSQPLADEVHPAAEVTLDAAEDAADKGPGDRQRQVLIWIEHKGWKLITGMFLLKGPLLNYRHTQPQMN